MRDDFTRKIFGQRLARSTRPRLARSLSKRRLRCFGCSFRCCLGRLQFFQVKLQLFELADQLLTLAAEEHPPVLLNHQLQMFDLLAVLATGLVLSQQITVLRDHHRL